MTTHIKLFNPGPVEVRREILACTGALAALGIRPGERVAIVGLNSTRYLALDAAIEEDRLHAL